MANVKKLIPIIEKWEGGWSDNPKDPGGATYKGVTLKTFRQFYGKDKTKQDLRNMTPEQEEHILKVGYWDKCKADQINNQSIANYIVDFAYNAGISVAIKKVQKVLNLEVDGIIGPKTLETLNNCDQEKFFNDYKNARIKYYEAIVARRPTSKIFLAGWTRRANGFSYSK